MNHLHDVVKANSQSRIERFSMHYINCNQVIPSWLLENITYIFSSLLKYSVHLNFITDEKIFDI